MEDPEWRTKEIWEMISGIKQGYDFKEIDAYSLNDEEQLDVRSRASQIYLNRY